MEYQTKSDWMKQTGSLGAISELSIYDSPYSGCPSANSIYGKNLTMGVLPKEFKAPNLTVLPTTDDWVYKERPFLQHFNGNVSLDALNQYAKKDARTEGAIGDAGGHSVVNPDLKVSLYSDQTSSVSPAVATVAGAGNVVTGTITPGKESFEESETPDCGTMYQIPGLVGSIQTCECFKEKYCPCKHRYSSEKVGCIVLVCILVVGCIIALVFGCCPDCCKCSSPGSNTTSGGLFSKKFKSKSKW